MINTWYIIIIVVFTVALDFGGLTSFYPIDVFRRLIQFVLASCIEGPDVCTIRAPRVDLRSKLPFPLKSPLPPPPAPSPARRG